MANIGISEGMGKKIVEALKQQTNGEELTVNPDSVSISMNMGEDNANVEFVTPQPVADVSDDNEVISQQNSQIQDLSKMTSPALGQNLTSFSGKADINLADMDGLEIPTNVAVLKQLITQLPSGVSRQTGAQIIKQTMEALGISMKSVLQEAQQVQENLNNTSKECQSSIVEHKKQIGILERQSQKLQRQSSALNDIISLFVQTSI